MFRHPALTTSYSKRLKYGITCILHTAGSKYDFKGECQSWQKHLRTVYSLSQNQPPAFLIFAKPDQILRF